MNKPDAIRTARTCAAIVAAILYCGPAAAQSAGGQMVRAAGMPLADGTLPPGSLTVRVVRGSFSSDVVGVPVTIVVDGTETRTAATAAQGRVEFAHLRVGAQVRTSAVVEGERLESDPFTMPAESGIRVLLVAGAGAGTPAVDGDRHAAMPGSAPLSAPRAIPAAGSDAPSNGGATAVRVTMVSLTVLAFAIVAAQQWRRRRA